MTDQKPKITAQRVDAPEAVTGDTPTDGEPDHNKLKEDMSKAADGDARELKARERAAEEDASAVKPDHRENNAGQ